MTLWVKKCFPSVNTYAEGLKLTLYIGLSNWLINAFNGEWLKTEDPIPAKGDGADSKRGRSKFKRELERENLLLLPD